MRSQRLKLSTPHDSSSMARISVAALDSWNSDSARYSCWPRPPAPTKPRMAAMRILFSQRYRV
ncbi:hypothetical protein D3C87_2204400 [compost metagenome]